MFGVRASGSEIGELHTLSTQVKLHSVANKFDLLRIVIAHLQTVS